LEGPGLPPLLEIDRERFENNREKIDLGRPRSGGPGIDPGRLLQIDLGRLLRIGLLSRLPHRPLQFAHISRPPLFPARRSPTPPRLLSSTPGPSTTVPTAPLAHIIRTPLLLVWLFMRALLLLVWLLMRALLLLAWLLMRAPLLLVWLLMRTRKRDAKESLLRSAGLRGVPAHLSRPPPLSARSHPGKGPGTGSISFRSRCEGLQGEFPGSMVLRAPSWSPRARSWSPAPFPLSPP